MALIHWIWGIEMRAMSPRWLLSVLLVFVLQSASIVDAGDVGQSLIAEPKIQSQIDRTIGVIVDHWEGKASEAEVVKSINTLESMQVNKMQLIPQLIFARSAATNQEKRLSALVIIEDQIMKELNPSDVVDVVVPYMEVTNGSLRSEVRETLDNLRARSGHTSPFAVFAPYLQRHGQNASKPLIKYMLRAIPDEAMKEIQGAFTDKRSSADHDTTGQPLKSMVTNGHWWEELYASEKMRQNPKLRDPELIEQLKRSNHIVVRESVKEIEVDKK